MRKEKAHIIIISFLACFFCAVAAFAQEKNVQIKRNGAQDSLRLAYDYEVKGLYNRSIAILQKLNARTPNNMAYYQSLRRNLLRAKRYDELESLLKDRLKRRENDILTQADWADLLFKKGQEREALIQWESVLSRNKNNPYAYERVAQRLLDNQLMKEAIDVYKRGRKTLKNSTVFVFKLAELYIIQLQYKEAAKEYIAYLRAQPAQWQVVRSRLLSYATTDAAINDIANELVNHLGNTNINLPLHRILGALFMRSGRYEEALHHYVAIDSLGETSKRKNAVEGSNLYNFAENTRKAGDLEIARKAFEIFIRRHPKSAMLSRIEYSLAQTYADLENYDEAIARFKAISQKYTHMRYGYLSLIALADIYFEHNHDVIESMQILKTVYNKYPMIPEKNDVCIRLGDCVLLQNNFSEAEKWYKKALVLQQKSAKQAQEKALLSLAELAFFQGNPDTALYYIDRIATIPRKKGVIESGAQVNNALQLSLLINENREGGDDALKRYALAQLLVRQWREEEALEKLYEVTKMQPEPEVIDETFLAIGELEARLHHPEEAIAAYEQLLTRCPESHLRDKAIKNKGEIYEHLIGDVILAQQTYEKLLTDYPHSVYIEEVREKIRAMENKNHVKPSKATTGGE